MEPEEIQEYLNQTEYNTRLPYGSGIKRQKALQKAARENYRRQIAEENMAYSAPIANVGRYFPNDSVYDKGITIYDIDRGINTYRDQQQSDLLATGNALLHGGTALGAGILGTALLTNPYGLAAVAAFTGLEGLLQSTKEEPNYNPISWFTNNAIFQVMDATKSFIDESTPVYTEDMDKEGLSKFAGLAGFDALSQGIGFLAGGIGGSRMAAKKLSEGSKFYDTLLKVKGGDKILQGKTIEEAAKSGMLAANDLQKIQKAKDFADGVSGLTASVVGRIGESVIEAQGTKRELLEKGYSEEEADAAMDKSFLANMALSSVDYIQNIKMLGTFKNVLGTESKLAAYSDDVIKAQQAGKKVFTKGDKALSVLSALGKNAVLEGGEEGLQFAINKAAQDSAIEGSTWLSFLKNMGSEFQNSFTDEEGQLGWILGGLLGGGAASISQAANIKVKDKELANIIADAESLKTDLAENYKVYDNGLYSVYTKPDGSKEKVINQDYINTIHHNSELEAVKQYAQENGDKALYNVAQNKQVLNKALFALKTDNFKNFVTELETSKNISVEELQNIKAVQENKPVNEVEVSKEDVDNYVTNIEKTLDLINSLKVTYDAAMTLPQIANLPKTAIFKLAEVISSQKALAKEIENIKPEMLSALEEYSNEYQEIYYTGKRTKAGKPDKRNKEYKESGLAVALDAIKDPILREAFKQEYDNYKDLNAANKILLSEYESYLKEPKKLIQEAAKDEVNKIKSIIKETSDETKEKEEIIDNAVKNNEEVIIETPEGEIITKVTGINPETQEIETEAGINITVEDLMSQKTDEPEVKSVIYDYDTEQTIFEGPKKPTIYSTSTSAHLYDKEGFKITTFTGSSWNELQYQFRTEHFNIVKFMSNPDNTPSKSKNFTVQLNLRPITEDLLKSINDARAANKLPNLNIKDLETIDYRPIGVSVYQNGKLVSTDITHFHDIDYFRNIAGFDELTPEEQETYKNEFRKERENIINLLTKGNKITLSVENKSNGVPNYNPKLNNKKQVNPINEVFSTPLLGKTSGAVPVRGIGVVTNLTEESYEITFENGSKQTYEIDMFTTINPVLGKVVFETVSANGSPYLLDAITFNEVELDTQKSIANLFVHKLFNGNEIKLRNTKFNIIEEGSGLLNNLVYLGERKSAKEKQIFFKKDGTLIVGKKQYTSKSDMEEVKDAVYNHLTVYHKFPKYPLGSIRNKTKIILPTEIDVTGEVLSDVPVMTVEKYLFAFSDKQPNPLIGTNINSTVNFVNSYFTYSKGPNGMLDIKTDEKKPETKPFANDLSKESTEVKKEPTAPVSDKKADIERIRQEANNKNEEFIQQINVINAEEVADRDNLINKLIKNIPLPANTRINNWVLEELNGKLWEGKNIRGKEEEFFGKENWDKIKEAKKQFDIEFKKIKDSNLAKIKLIEQKQSDLLNTADGIELRRAWSLGLIEEPNIVGLDETNFISKETELKKNGDLVETDNYEGYYYLSKPNKDEDWYEIIIGKTKKEVEDKINAKYDAELAALEGKPVTEVKTEDVTDKAKEINQNCNGIQGNKPIEPGPGGGIDPDEIFK